MKLALGYVRLQLSTSFLINHITALQLKSSELCCYRLKDNLKIGISVLFLYDGVMSRKHIS